MVRPAPALQVGQESIGAGMMQAQGNENATALLFGQGKKQASIQEELRGHPVRGEGLSPACKAGWTHWGMGTYHLKSSGSKILGGVRSKGCPGIPPSSPTRLLTHQLQ